MSWQQAMKFAAWLNELGYRARVTGKKNFYGVWVYTAKPAPFRDR